MQIDTPDTVETTLGFEVEALLDRVAASTGRPAMSDHLVLDLVDTVAERRKDDHTPVVVTGRDDHGTLEAYLQASEVAAGRALEIVVDTGIDARTNEAGSAIHRDLLDTALRRIGHLGGGHVDWWVDRPTSVHDELAAAAGLTRSRTLAQMRRPLPLEPTERTDLATRGFIVGEDDEEWLWVNSRAFAGHGEQSGWTQATLDQRLAEDWFDPEGFRIHERDGRIAGFCWTKIHPATNGDVALGEIYVIAVDPDFHGLGLGRAMTLAGLQHLESVGLGTAMLWVDTANEAGALYRRLGFEPHSTKAAYSIVVPPSPIQTDDRSDHP